MSAAAAHPGYIVMDAWATMFNMTLDEFLFAPQSHPFWVHLAPSLYENYNWLFLWFGLLYVPIVFGGIKLMENREPFNLGYSLTVWNFLMALFSAWGAIYTILPVARWGYHYGFNPNTYICDFWIYDQPSISQLAVFFFVVSKVFEFIDTVFLVLRKRPVIFLHWYHHVITFLFTWYSNMVTHHHNSAGFYFCLMNYFVHAFMYLYYMLVSMKIYPKWDLFITLIQLGQMVLGVVIIVISMSCDTTDWTAVLFGLILYASFFYLFIQIFQRRYMTEGGFRATAAPRTPTASSPTPKEKSN